MAFVFVDTQPNYPLSLVDYRRGDLWGDLGGKHLNSKPDLILGVYNNIMNKKGQDPKEMTGAAMRGGIDISDIDQYPNGNYWARSARGALKAVRLMCGCEIYENIFCKNDDCKVTAVMSAFWNEENTWIDICIKTEHARDLLKALQKK